jgi:uncharacterized protein YqcC (DUF446 family)
MPPEPKRVRDMLTRIENEMRQAGFWQAAPLPEEAYEFRQAFAMDTMAYPQWLQFIFVPRVKAILDGGGDWPSSSAVGAQAIREFDGLPEASALITLLCEFDGLLV